jgi:hypothetical protein
MNSLTTGAWGSFFAPCSRALGGKSGITRAAPLVFFAFGQRLQLLLLLIVLTPWSALVASPPPENQGAKALALDQNCPQPAARPNPKQEPQQKPETSVARTRERQSGSVQNEGASERAHALFSACARDERRAKSAR